MCLYQCISDKNKFKKQDEDEKDDFGLREINAVLTTMNEMMKQLHMRAAAMETATENMSRVITKMIEDLNREDT